ncbi:hypothetical protein GCM10027062_36860 [Nocardioides hungaricus]
MLLGLCLIIVTLLGWSLAAVATKPAGRASRQRDLERRFRQLHRTPDRVNLLDVENLMLSESIPLTTVRRVLDRAVARRISARTMWRWAEAYGASRLVTVLDAGLAHDTLLEHLDAGTHPDWTALDVFAGLAADMLPAGMPIDELVDLDAVPGLEDLTYPSDLAGWSTLSPDPLELRQFDHLPPISGPGLTPFRPIASFGGDDDWPEAA